MKVGLLPWLVLNMTNVDESKSLAIQRVHVITTTLQKESNVGGWRFCGSAVLTLPTLSLLIVTFKNSKIK